MNDVLTALLIVVGGAFMLLAGVGVVRMPDLFMRLQAATKAATLGAGCMLLAVAVHFGSVTVTTRALLVIAFIFLTAPVAAHVIARAAYSVGMPLWKGTIVNELQQHLVTQPTREDATTTPENQSPAPEDQPADQTDTANR